MDRIPKHVYHNTLTEVCIVLYHIVITNFQCNVVTFCICNNMYNRSSSIASSSQILNVSLTVSIMREECRPLVL